MVPEDSEALITAINLYKIFPTSIADIPVIKGISLSVFPKDKLILVGASGSGKTTLVSMLTGIITPSAGQIFWKGIPRQINNISKQERTKYRRGFIGHVDQESELFPQLSVQENIELTAKIAGLKEEDYRDHYDKLIEILGISPLLNRKSGRLSRGQMKLISIAGALITKPQILVGDEPVANLDPKNAEEILNLFEVINAELDTAFLLTTHDQSVVSRGDRVIEIQDGFLLGTHSKSVNLWNLDETRTIPIDNEGRISIPRGILEQINNPKYVNLSVDNGKLTLIPDFELEKEIREDLVRECQNCATRSNEKHCPNCGYPTILLN